jgi:hypothetical protein
MTTTTRTLGALAATAVLAGTLGASVPAQAQGSGVSASGHCTGHIVSKLKAKHSNGAIEIEWEVDSNRNGQRWIFRIRQDNVIKASGVRRTLAPSGSFNVHKRIADARGVHRIIATATNPTTGAVCRAVVSI